MAYSHEKDCPQYVLGGRATDKCTCKNGPFFYCSCGHPGLGCYCA